MSFYFRLICAGGGAKAITDATSIPGCSRFFGGGRVLWPKADIDSLLGRRVGSVKDVIYPHEEALKKLYPGKAEAKKDGYVSMRVALELSDFAWREAERFKPEGVGMVHGVAMTCTERSVNDRPGKVYEAFIAVRTGVSGQVVRVGRVSTNAGTREEQENFFVVALATHVAVMRNTDEDDAWRQLSKQMSLLSFDEAKGKKLASVVLDVPYEMPSSNIDILAKALKQQLVDHNTIVVDDGKWCCETGRIEVCYDGPPSFDDVFLYGATLNPLHHAHLVSADEVERFSRKTCMFHISRTHPVKGVIPDEVVLDAVRALWGRYAVIIDEEVGLFKDKHARYGVPLLMGADVFQKVCTTSPGFPEWLLENDAKVYVVNRPGYPDQSDVGGPVIFVNTAQCDVSSTQVRRAR